jgi:hypothetical protein
MFPRNLQKVIKKSGVRFQPTSARFLSTGNNVTVVPEVTYVQTQDVLNNSGSRSFLGRVVAVGDKVKNLKVDDYVFPCDKNLAVEGYNKVEGSEKSFHSVGEEEYLDTLVGGVLPSTISGSLNLLSKCPENSTIFACVDQSAFSVDFVRAAKTKGHHIICSVSDSYGMKEYIKTLHVLYAAGADVVVPEYLVGSSIYNEIVADVTGGATKANVVLQSDETPNFKAEGDAFKKAKGFNARKELIEDFKAAGTLESIKTTKNINAVIDAKATVLTYTKVGGLASVGNWMDNTPTKDVKAAMKEALTIAPFLDYDIDHSVDYDNAVELVMQNYRNGNFNRVVLYSLNGTDEADLPVKNEKGPLGEIFLNELGNVDPDHPLVEQDVHEFLLDEDEMLEDTAGERRPKGHQGFI